MGGLNVKNTIVERLLEHVAPHYCSGCGKVGSVVCAYCKYNITHEPFLGCFLCGAPSRGGICTWHDSAIERMFVVSERSGVLETTINSLKFQHTKAAAKVLAELIDQRLPILPSNTVIVPVPTVRSHIRQRGYDQVELIARHLAELRGLTIARLLSRENKETQHELGREDRQMAIQDAFGLTQQDVPRDAPLLLLDDIITTGATIEQAAVTLAPLERPIWATALAYQPLD